jgi:hypothetical protein
LETAKHKIVMEAMDASFSNAELIECFRSFGEIGYMYETRKEELCLLIKTIFAGPEAFDLNKKTRIMPYLKLGFPPDTQDLMNTAPRDLSPEMQNKRENELVKLRRLCQDLRGQLYGFPTLLVKESPKKPKKANSSQDDVPLLQSSEGKNHPFFWT